MDRSHLRSRRRFVQGLAGGALAIASTRHFDWAAAADSPAAGDAGAVLSGTDFNLTIGALPVNFTGAPGVATAVNGRIPAPLLRWREGDTITLRVSNRLSAPTSIHWHGMIVPADMDGVPGLSFKGIGPGETYAYRFKVNQAGTYWYHSHSRFQEQTGLYGPIVIAPRRGERHRADREHVVLLSEWTDLDPEHIYRTLKIQSNYFNFAQRTVGDFFNDVRKQGWKPTLADRLMWGQMRMDPTDLADVSGYAYTYLMNGTTPTGNWTGAFRRGERVRLRFINGSSMTFFDIRIPGLKLTVVATDGQDVEPVSVDEFRIGIAEVYDVIVEPKDDRAYTIFAQSFDRSGYARGTLAPQPGMQAEVPPLDPRPLLTMMDMGMAMGHDMSGMDMSGMDMSSMKGMGDDAGDKKGAQQGPSAAPKSGSMEGMDMDHDMSNMQGMDHGAMDHGAMAMGNDKGSVPHHAPAEYGPNVDSLAMQPQSRLDDPGIGLRSNGRRVLTYADLHTLGGPIDHRQAGRDVELHLTGHMERFVWSFSGQKFSESEPLRFNYGERLRLVLVNDSMMNHPIHLHGMWGEIESDKGEFLVRKHTITVQPGQRLTYLVTADALGRWAYHCHLLYHME
ncbi:MAG TPA: copper resistance system multicopper oxidase, partial [Steroidobacteraceae bacterium]|nr:copper resistance system multicopper oxidase [Steroidobacteraceae bacterium]